MCVEERRMRWKSYSCSDNFVTRTVDANENCGGEAKKLQEDIAGNWCRSQAFV